LWQTVDLLELGDIEAADAAAEVFRRLGTELREPAFNWVATVLRGLRTLMEGRFAEAEELAAEAVTAGQRIDPTSAMTNYGAQMLSCWREQGRTTELESVRDALLPAIAMPAAQAGLALISCDLGRLDEGRDVFERLAANDFRDFPHDNSWLPGVAILTLVCAIFEDARRARALYELLERYSTLHVVAGFADYLGPVAHYLGLLAATMGDHDKAAEHFEHALGAGETTGSRVYLVHTQFEYARVLVTLGDQSRACELLGAARETATELGMQPVIDKVQALAVASAS
jgi:tetratricopeptide (TPR) repeat protein